MDRAEYLLSIIKPLVDKPESVQVDAKSDEMGILLTLYVAPEDMGKIIGKEGQTAKALRLILRAFGAKEKARISMQIYEPDRMSRPRPYNQRDTGVSTNTNSPDDLDPLTTQI